MAFSTKEIAAWKRFESVRKSGLFNMMFCMENYPDLKAAAESPPSPFLSTENEEMSESPSMTPTPEERARAWLNSQSKLCDVYAAVLCRRSRVNSPRFECRCDRIVSDLAALLTEVGEEMAKVADSSARHHMRKYNETTDRALQQAHLSQHLASEKIAAAIRSLK